MVESIDDVVTNLSAVQKLLCRKTMTVERQDTLEFVYVTLMGKAKAHPSHESFRQWYDDYVLYRAGIKYDREE